MHISVRYKPDLKKIIPKYIYKFISEVIPKSFHVAVARNYYLSSTAVGVLAIIAALAVPPDGAAPFYAIGAAMIIQMPLLLLVGMLMGMYRSREILRQEIEVTITSEGIQRRTKAYTLRVTWDMVERVDELEHSWLFVPKGPKGPTRQILLGKWRLSQEQQAELAAFIEARHLNKQAGKMTPAQEASHALAQGVARSDLKPEVQAEYDKLVAERGPA